MPQVIIWLPAEKAEALRAVAQRERRDPRQQAALFVERALARQMKRSAEQEVVTK